MPKTIFDNSAGIYVDSGKGAQIKGPLNMSHIVRLNSTEDVADGAAISLHTAVSTFSTAGSGETATLAAGTDGQIKMLSLISDGGGDMVVSVTNASWDATDATITFADVGDAVTLVYAGSKWNIVCNHECALSS